jgi:hypothetical protein
MSWLFVSSLPFLSDQFCMRLFGILAGQLESSKIGTSGILNKADQFTQLIAIVEEYFDFPVKVVDPWICSIHMQRTHRYRES